jgi:hypothetical protein
MHASIDELGFGWMFGIESGGLHICELLASEEGLEGWVPSEMLEDYYFIVDRLADGNLFEG